MTFVNSDQGGPKNQNCISASAISSLDGSDIVQLCPNSVFTDKDDISTSEYFTTELNIEIKKKLLKTFALSKKIKN